MQFTFTKMLNLLKIPVGLWAIYFCYLQYTKGNSNQAVVIGIAIFLMASPHIPFLIRKVTGSNSIKG